MNATCTLTVTSGPAAGTAIEVERELVVGREDADLTIPDTELSRRHAILRPTDAGIEVEDLGSLNGTFVNGERISGPVTLTADAAIRLGRSQLDMQLAAPPAPAPPEEAPEPAEDAQRTRLASAVTPPEPQQDALADPQMTRIRPAAQAPGEQAPGQQGFPEIQATRIRPVAPAAAPPAQPFPQIQATRVRPAAQAPAQADAPAATAVDGPPQAADARGQRRPGPLKRLLARLRGGGSGSEGAS